MLSIADIRIVLVNPSHPGNIGAIARVMKNMGLTNLWLVGPKKFPDAEATARAAGADDVMANAKVVDSIDAALTGVELIVGASARQRAQNWPLKSAHEIAPMLVEKAQQATVALLFGNEQSGLSNDELAYCHYQLYIDTNPAFASLNLASAVQICVYELRKAACTDEVAPISTQPLATHDEVTQFYEHLEAALITLGYLKPKAPGKLMYRLRRLFGRAQLETDEINILRGICAAIMPPKQTEK